jgi:hypothetical protein
MRLSNEQIFLCRKQSRAKKADTDETATARDNLALKDIIANLDDVEDAGRLQDLLAYDAELAAQGQTQYACAFASR